jgi:hypothetical protein
MKLQHGATRYRAQRIISTGPDPQYCEPGSQAPAGGFSTSVAAGPFYFGTPAEYASGKDQQFANEGGPVILEIDVPDDIVAKAVTPWFPLSQGLVQFDPGCGLEELLSVWQTIRATAQVRSVS